MTIAQYQRRHFYQNKDGSYKKKKFKWYKRKLKRLSGTRNDVHLAAYYPIIHEYIMRNSGLDCIDLDTILYLARLNRVFDKQDFMDAPNKYRARLVKAQMLRLEAKGYIEKWEGHSMNYRRCILYKLTQKAKGLINNFDQMLLRIKKIPLDPRYSDREFVTPRSQLANNKYKINWYAAVVDFNEAVDRENE